MNDFEVTVLYAECHDDLPLWAAHRFVYAGFYVVDDAIGLCLGPEPSHEAAQASFDKFVQELME